MSWTIGSGSRSTGIGNGSRSTGIALVLVAALAGAEAHAGCDNIPSETDVSRGAQGSITAPFAVPGQALQVRVRPEVCDATSVGLGTPPACVDDSAVRVTVIYQASAGAPANAVVLARDCGDPSDPGSLHARVAAWASQLPGGAATCEADPALDVVSADLGTIQECRLDFRFPSATGPSLAPPNTLTGPARIVVEPISSPLPTGLLGVRCADAVATSGTIACIDELYRTDGTCSTKAASVSTRFPGFTALPVPNDFAAMAEAPGGAARPELRFALDAAGNVLAPMEWSGVLCQTDANCTFEGFPPPQLVELLFPDSLGSGLDAAGQPVASGVPLSIPSSEFTSSHTLQGIELPPIFDPSSSTDQLALFGSTDAVQTVIRIQTRAPGRCSVDQRACVSDAGCANDGTTQTCDLDAEDLALADLRYCRHPNACQAPDVPLSTLPASGGPAVIPPPLYEARKLGLVPLEALNLCRNSDALSCVLKDEPLAGDVDANGDGDLVDPSVIELRDRRAGVSLPIGFDGVSGLATALLREGPAAVGPFGEPLIERPFAASVRPAVVTEAACAALLFAEPWENGGGPAGLDFNADGEVFDTILRVFCREAPGVVREVAADAAAEAGLGGLLGASARRLILQSPRTLSTLQGGGEPIALVANRAYFLLDEVANSSKSTQRLDMNALGQPGCAPAFAPLLSEDGSLACFTSRSDLLGPSCSASSRWDVYCRDLATGGLDLATRAQATASGGPLCGSPVAHANGSSVAPSLSGDGRLVCFESDATNLIGAQQDQNAVRDVFVHDRATCRTVRVSLTASGAAATKGSKDCSMAAHGGYAAFSSLDRLAPQDTDGSSDAYLVPLLGGSSAVDPVLPGPPLLLSGGLTGQAAAPSVSADASRVAFELASGTGLRTVVRDLVAGVPVDVLAFQLDGRRPKLSDDGRSLTLTNVDPQTGATRAVIVDLVATIARGEPVLEPLALTSTLEDIDAPSSTASAQASTAAFMSPAELVPGDSPSPTDDEVHVRQLDTGLLKRVGNNSKGPSLSGDGSSVAYLELASTGDAAFRRGPIPGAELDLDGNGSTHDLVLATLDLEHSPPAMEILGAALQAAVAGPTAAYVAPDGGVFVRSCPAGTSCAANALLAPSGAPARATAVAASESVVCAILADDGQVACAGVGDGSLAGLGLPGLALGVVGESVVFTTDESLSRLVAFRREAGGFVQTFAGGPGTRRFVLSENGFAAFDRCELDAGADLNGDGIEDECVLGLLALGSGELFEPAATLLPCTLEACDRRFPWRVFPAGAHGEAATVRFLSSECQEDGTCAGCSADACAPDARSCDLDLDGDCADVVVRDVTSGGAPVLIATLGDQVDADPLAGSSSGGVDGQGAVFPTLLGRCDVDVEPATEPSSRSCQTDADCPAGLVCGPPFSALALNDEDGDGVFDGSDNCPTAFNPDQSDADANGVGDACQGVAASCGDGTIDPDEVCDDGERNGACSDRSLDQCGALGASGSFCDAGCKPVAFLDVTESAVNPGKNGVLPAKVFGTPYLNLGPALPFDGVKCALPAGCPANMLDLTSIRLEGLTAGAACAGDGAPVGQSSLVDPNSDGIKDLELKFQVLKASIAKGDDEACMVGKIRPETGRYPELTFEARDRLNVR